MTDTNAPAPAAMVGEEEVARVICGIDPPDTWMDEARAVLTLFAPLAQEVERLRAERDAALAQGAGLQAALASARQEERERCARIALPAVVPAEWQECDDWFTKLAEMKRIAAAIRAGETE